MMMKKMSAALLTAAALLAPGAEELKTDFAGEGQTTLVETNNAAALVREEGKLLYRSNREKIGSYRWLSLSAPDRVQGDFEAEFRFGIRRMDHFNSTKIFANAADKSWSVVLFRRQFKPGEQQLMLQITRNGKSEQQILPESGKEGTLKLQRKGESISFFWKSGDSEFKECFPAAGSLGGETVVGIGFDTPANTASEIELQEFRLKAAAVSQTTLWEPRYQPAGPAAKESSPVFLAGGSVDAEGWVTLQPGGRVVYAMRGPWNIRRPRLEWESAGALKISAIQPGTSETIQLGETLLWDDTPKENPERRSLDLGGFVTRYPHMKRWRYPAFSSNHLYFVTFTPALQEAVTLSAPELTGEVMMPHSPLAGIPAVKAEVEQRGGRRVFSWKAPEIFRNWWGNSRLRTGELLELAGIPFRISPALLSPESPALELEINAGAGMLHIAHVGGEQKADSPWNAAAYLVCYADGSTETLWATMRWNTGVYASEYFPQRQAPDYTWWGPPGFSRARAQLLPGRGNGVHWNSVYVTSCINPCPEKEIRSIQAIRMPGDERRFVLLGVTFDDPEKEWGVIEPAKAVFSPGEEVGAAVMLYSPVSRQGALPGELELCKTGGAKVPLGKMDIAWHGRFGYARSSFTVPADQSLTGPVRLVCGEAVSSPLGLLPDAKGDFQYTMIAGGGETRAEFEQMRRLGYDAVKIQIQWTDIEPEQDRFDWSRWKRNVARIAREGLKIGVRNHHSSRAKYLPGITSPLQRFIPGQPAEPAREYDPCDPVHRARLINYYREVGKFSARYPEITSINANYIVGGGVGRKELRYAPALLAAYRKRLAGIISLEEVNRRTGLSLASFDDITPEMIWADSSRTLLHEYVRTAQEANASLQREVVMAIREGGYQGHMTFNSPMHTTEHVMMGLPFAEYLKLARDFPPGSPFHESSDRYTLSFVKWLAAKRTLGLPFGDEGYQNPPSYEQNLLAYQWMAMMQCWDALYCQWWGGRPGAQNIAFIKPYHHMLYGAEYLPDRLSLTLALESGFAESPDLLKTGGHSTVMAHYGLGSTLRALNINADRYMIDTFSDLDVNVSSRLLVDDDSKSLSREFGDRIERFIREGGVFLATLDTDRLNDYAFFGRFGVEVKNGKASGTGIRRIPGKLDRVELSTGKGKLVLLEGSWATGSFDADREPEYYAFMKELFTSCGDFTPLAGTDILNVAATPYRAKNGDILIHVINLTAAERKVTLGVSAELLAGKGKAIDHGSGITLPATERIPVTVGPLESTVVRLTR